ncbi:hypothetical protein CR513_51674, partial [Mucuna pruriens]
MNNYCAWTHLHHGSPTYAILSLHPSFHHRHPGCIKRKLKVMPTRQRPCHSQVHSRLRDQLSPPLLSCSSRRRPSWINLDNPKGTRLWVLLAHHFPRRPPLRLEL